MEKKEKWREKLEQFKQDDRYDFLIELLLPYTAGFRAGSLDRGFLPILCEVEELLDKAREEGKKVTGETSDGYHTFNELYEHRHLLFSKLAEWKSKKHLDGTMFDDWFIAGIGKDKGEQITYHIPLRLWDSFNCEELDTAPEWDGHTANDVLKRLSKLTTK